MNSRQKDSLLVALLTFFALLAYFNSFRATFIFDDSHMILKNTFITSSKYFHNFFSGFVTSYPLPKGMCRPFLMLTFAFNYWNGKLDPVGYHIVNTLFHLLNGILLYHLLKAIVKNTSKVLIFLITTLFIVHPINTEAVTYISSRSDLMITFFLLAIFLSYLKGKRFLIFPLYVLALGTKETALCIPLIIFGYQMLYQYKNIKSFFKDHRNLIFLFFVGLITILYLKYKSLYFGGIHVGTFRPILSNIILQSWATFYYLKLFILPFNLNFFHYAQEFTSIFKLQALMPLLGVGSLISLVFITRKKHPIISLGLFIYIIGLLPKFYATLRIPLMEHHFYMPSIGIYILLLYLLEKLYTKNKIYVLYPTIGILLIFVTLTWERNHQLTRALYTWRVGVEKEPKHIANWINLGLEYRKRGHLNKSKEFLEKILISFDDVEKWQMVLHVNLANIYFDEGDSQKAITYLNKALELNKNPYWLYTIYKSFATIYEKEKNQELSINYFNKALELNSHDWSLHQDMAKFHMNNNDLEKAKESMGKSLEIHPHAPYSYFLLGKISELENNFKEAENYYKTSIKLKNNWSQSHWALCLIYLKLENPLFIKELEKTIELDPNFKPALVLGYSLTNTDDK